MIAFIDQVRDRFGVEATCRVLVAIATGFTTARGDRAAETRPSLAPAVRDESLGTEIANLHAENYGDYDSGRACEFAVARPDAIEQPSSGGAAHPSAQPRHATA